MRTYLGIDTSNYATSFARCDESFTVLEKRKTFLEVREGERGLRQNEAVFSHVKNIIGMSGDIRKGEFPDGRIPDACAVSVSPRNEKGSYMPCFLVGQSVAEMIGAVLGIPVFRTSHQAGHVISAVGSVCGFDREKTEDLLGSEFIVLHVSGGTTDILLSRPDDDDVVRLEKIGGTLDVNAGQIVDRTGVRMGMHFPSGRYVDEMALNNDKKIIKTKRSVKGGWFNLSGTENKAADLISQGATAEYVSEFVLSFIADTLAEALENLKSEYGDLPVIFSGGVMSSRYISGKLSDLGSFAKADYSSDNAAGIALYAAIMDNRRR